MIPLAVALDPDVDAFMGGFETAVVAGGIVLIALVVAHVVKRFVSF